MSRKGPLAGVSWLQLIAGALAAMTSAWVASYLGVAGTIIGAAVGSLVASIASTVYVNGLDRGHTIITANGSVVSKGDGDKDPDTSASGGDTQVLVADSEDGDLVEADTEDEPPPWRRILVWTAAMTVTALVLIGGYELATGSSFGNPDNPSIGRSLTDRSGDEPAEPDESTDPTEQPSTSPTTAPTTSAPTQEAPPATQAPTPDPQETTPPAEATPEPADPGED